MDTAALTVTTEKFMLAFELLQPFFWKGNLEDILQCIAAQKAALALRMINDHYSIGKVNNVYFNQVIATAIECLYLPARFKGDKFVIENSDNEVKIRLAQHLPPNENVIHLIAEISKFPCELNTNNFNMILACKYYDVTEYLIKNGIKERNFHAKSIIDNDPKMLRILKNSCVNCDYELIKKIDAVFKPAFASLYDLYHSDFVPAYKAAAFVPYGFICDYKDLTTKTLDNFIEEILVEILDENRDKYAALIYKEALKTRKLTILSDEYVESRRDMFSTLPILTDPMKLMYSVLNTWYRYKLLDAPPALLTSGAKAANDPAKGTTASTSSAAEKPRRIEAINLWFAKNKKELIPVLQKFSADINENTKWANLTEKLKNLIRRIRDTDREYWFDIKL